VAGEGFGGGLGSCISNAAQSIEIIGCDFVDNGAAFGAGARLGGFANATVIDCTFAGNEASHGGGLFTHGNWKYASNLLIQGCRFADNESSFGAGANISGDRNMAGMQTTLTVSDCVFSDNHAGFGGGLLLSLAMDTGYLEPDAQAFVTNCRFEGNVVDACCNTGIYHTPCFVDGLTNGKYWGGAADMRTQYGGLIEIANCLVNGNDAVRAGGFHLVTCGGGEIRLINSTVADNFPSGVHVRQGVEALQLAANVLIANDILTGNGTGPDKQLINHSASDPLISFEARYSLVDGGYPGAGNITGDPAFLLPEFGAYCLEPGSVAIDAGDNVALPPYLVGDIEGLQRRVDDPNTADTGNGTAPIVDMGAHEAQDCGCLLGASYCGPAIPNSIGLPGRLRAVGSDFAGESLILLASDLPPNQFGYFLLSLTQGVSYPPGSSGRLCLAGNIGRFNRQGEVGHSGPAGALSLVVDTTDIPPSSSILVGETWSFQAWHRDVGSTSNFTDGVEILFR